MPLSAFVPQNRFVLDLSRPPRGQSSDPAYSVVKSMLGQGGYVSQFVNFATYDHGNPRDLKRSSIILSGVARQILSKCGVRIVSRELSFLFLVHLDIHKLTLIASLAVVGYHTTLVATSSCVCWC